MKQNPITRRAFARASIVLTALALSSFTTVSAAEAGVPTPPDLTADRQGLSRGAAAVAEAVRN